MEESDRFVVIEIHGLKDAHPDAPLPDKEAAPYADAAAIGLPFEDNARKTHAAAPQRPQLFGFGAQKTRSHWLPIARRTSLSVNT
jgi:hypothetical protein